MAAGDLLLFPEAILGSDVQFVLARAIRNIGNPLAIRRPRDQLLANSRRSSEVANATLLRRDRKHVAARGKNGALAVRRDVEIRDVLAHAGPVLHALVAFAGHRNSQLFRLFRLKVERIEIACVLEDDCIWPKARPHNIEIIEVSELFDLLAAQVVTVQIEVMFGPSVRAEVNRIPMPHGKRIRPVRVWHIFAGVVLQIVNRDRLCQASRVALPGAKIAKDLVIGNFRPVG